MRRVSWGPVLVPFTLSRILLLIVGWFSQYFPADPARPFHLLQQGFAATPNRLIDIWFRSDSAYYMSIVTIDYPGVADLANTQSNFGFFPLYPYLLRPFLLGIYNLTGSYDLVLLLGIVISNLLLLGAGFLLYKLISTQFSSDLLAKRTVWLLMFFPTSFFLSSIYAESLFLTCQWPASS